MTVLRGDEQRRGSVLHSGYEFQHSASTEKGIQSPMAQGRSTKVISVIEWIRTSRLSIQNSPSLWSTVLCGDEQRRGSVLCSGYEVQTCVQVMRFRRPCLVPDRATLPQKWPPPPRNVADSCEPTGTTKPTKRRGSILCAAYEVQS